MKRIRSILGLSVIFLAVIIVFTLQNLYDMGRKLSAQIYEPLPMVQSINDPTKLPTLAGPIIDATMDDTMNEDSILVDQEKESQLHSNLPFTLLVMGVDRRTGDQGRSDVLMLATINPQSNSTLILNIPRDTRMSISGAHIEDKVNHAYAFGGTAMTIATVEQFIGLPVDYYMKLDMDGFQEIIDVIGGIKVENTIAFQYDGHNFALGDLELQGDEALAYVRMRYDDPLGDLGRNDRQKLVVKAIITKLLQLNHIFKLNKFVDAIERNLKTNISFEEWMRMSVDYRKAISHIDSEKLIGHGEIKDGIYYYMVSEEERARISEQFQLHIDQIDTHSNMFSEND